jgi:hypothetical protein
MDPLLVGCLYAAVLQARQEWVWWHHWTANKGAGELLSGSFTKVCVCCLVLFFALVVAVVRCNAHTC